MSLRKKCFWIPSSNPKLKREKLFFDSQEKMVSAARSNYNTSGEYDEGPLRHYHGAASSSSSLSRAAARKSCGDTLPPCCGALCPLWLREVDETNIRLVWLALVQLLYVFAELAAAIVFNSLAMMADAFHNLGRKMLLFWLC